MMQDNQARASAKERKDCLSTTNIVNATSPTGPGNTADHHCIHAVKHGQRQENHTATISETMLSGLG